MIVNYPFSAVVGLDDLKLALVLNAVSPRVGGVLVRGEKGTAKSTIVRALAAQLPPVEVVAGCRFACDPAAPDPGCPDGPHEAGQQRVRRPAALVELPVGASEDRLVGSLDVERALTEGVKAFEPGLLAAAHRGVLYVDEVNLLHDHLVDLLLGPPRVVAARIVRDRAGVDRQADIELRAGRTPVRVLLDWSYPGERKDIEVRLGDGRTLHADMLAGHPGFKASLWHEYAGVLDAFERRREEGALVLDTRPPEAFGGGHIPGALNVGLGPAFATWAGTVLPATARVLLVLDRPQDLWEATWQLLRIGYRLPEGWLAGGMSAWRVAAGPVESLPQITVDELNDGLGDGRMSLLDVRQPAEWSGGHAPGAFHITGAELPDRVGEVPDAGPLAVTCSSGYRSSVAASLLARHGRTGLHNVIGGMSAWTAAGHPAERS